MYKIDSNITPGENIKEFMKAHGWIQEDLAEVMEVSLKTINNLIQNKQSVSLEMAKLLSAAFPGTTPYKWVLLDTKHQLKGKDTKSPVQIKSMIYKYLPVAELVKRGWLKKTNDINDFEKQVEKFSGKSVSDLKSFFEGYKKTFAANFRKSEAHQQFNDIAAETWCHMVELCSKYFTTPIYKKSQLQEVYSKLNFYTVKEEGVAEFLDDLNSAGVKFMVLPHLQKTYIDGAAFLINNTPVIVYTARYKRLDNFWFTIAHEIAHVLAHLDKDHIRIIDDIHGGDNTDGREKEADDMAKEHLKLNEVKNYFNNSLNYITESKINACSEDLQVHRAIVVGTLAFEKTISYKHLHLFNEDITQKIPKRYWAETYIN